MIASIFILPIVMAKGDDIPDYDKGDLCMDDFKNMAKDMVNKSESAGAVLVRFAHIVQLMVDTNVI